MGKIYQKIELEMFFCVAFFKNLWKSTSKFLLMKYSINENLERFHIPTCMTRKQKIFQETAQKIAKFEF